MKELHCKQRKYSPTAVRVSLQIKSAKLIWKEGQNTLGPGRKKIHHFLEKGCLFCFQTKT